jgi:hypothetical protein
VKQSLILERIFNENKTEILYRSHRPAVHMMNEFAYPSSVEFAVKEKAFDKHVPNSRHFGV